MSIQVRKGTNAEWEANKSSIIAGEPVITTDSKRAFYGVDSGQHMELTNIDLVASAYNSSITYNIGNYCIYQGKLYVCNTNNITGTWNSNYWNNITIQQSLDDVASKSVPLNVREAIYTLLNNAAYATTGLTDEIAIVETWAEEVVYLSLSNTSLSLSGSTPQTLIPTVVPSSASVSWSSSDNSIATVVGGVVTGVSNGSCVITASAGNLSATCSVTVSGFATLESISAVYTQSGTVYDTDSLDSLRTDLVVTGTYSDSSTEVITAYTLSGTLTAGTSTITVAYGGKTTTFDVTVTAWDYEWDYSDGYLSANGFTMESGTTGSAVLQDNGLLITANRIFRKNDNPICTKCVFETTFTLITFDGSTGNNRGYRIIVYNGNRAVTLNVKESGLEAYNYTTSSYDIASPVSLNRKYKLRVEAGQSEGKLYLDGTLVLTVPLGSTASTSSLVAVLGSNNGRQVLVEDLRYSYQS